MSLFEVTADPAGTRRCGLCGQSKPLVTAFRKGWRRPAGYETACRDCQYERERERRAARGPDYRRSRSQWQLYRLRWADYQEMLDRQGGACVICMEPFGDDPRLIAVDHDHGCDHPGKGGRSCRACVRGILCNRCNMFVGWVESDYRRLSRILGYLGPRGAAIGAHIARSFDTEPVVFGSVPRVGS